MRLFLKLLGHSDAVSLVQSGKGKPMGAGAELVQRLVTIMASQPDDAVVVVWALAGRRARLNVDPMGPTRGTKSNATCGIRSIT